jgi:hypothetical protein
MVFYMTDRNFRIFAQLFKEEYHLLECDAVWLL